MCIMYLFGAWLGEVDSTPLTGVINTHREEVVLVAVAICQKQTQKIRMRNNNAGLNQWEAWAFFFLKLCYFNIFTPSQYFQICSGVDFKHSTVSGNKESVFFSFPCVSRITGTPACFLRANTCQAALVSLMPFNNVGRLEASFSPLISIAINYCNHNAMQASSNVQTGTEPPKSQRQLFKAQTLQCSRFSCRLHTQIHTLNMTQPSLH